MKKLTLIFLMCMLMVLSASIFACDNNQEQIPHEHTYSNKWSSDNTYHWHEATCEHSEQVSDKAEHSYGEDNKCTDCNYENEGEESTPPTPGTHNHTYSEEWSSDNTYHWHEATCEHKDEVTGKSIHTFGPNDICIVCGQKSYMYTEPVRELKYQLNEDGVSYSVAGIGNVTEAEIVIPTTYNAMPVTRISQGAFSSCSNIESVIIPQSIISIGDYAFNGCSKLANVTIPNGVVSIGNSAFSNCRSLTVITIPNSVTSIEDWAFAGCSSLESLIIGSSVTSIGKGAFGICGNLASITVSSDNKVYHSDGNCIIKTVTKIMVIGCKVSIIPNDGSVTSIGDMAFYYCDGLKSITIPDVIISIGEYAFYVCTNLESIIIGNSLKSIGDKAFTDCESLENIIIPDSVESIGEDAFSGCKSLKSLTIPDSVTSIGNGIFWYCSSLESVIIGNGVTNIGTCMFSGCSSLESIIIPDSVTNIGYGAFDFCSSLSSITIGSNVKSIDESSFYLCTNLERVLYKGTAEEWANINAGDYSLTVATKYYYSETEPQVGEDGNYDGNYWHYVDGEIAVWVK